MTLKGVQHGSDPRLNLIFGTSLDSAGYGSYFENGRWKLTEGFLVIARENACNTLYKTHVKLC